MLKMNISIELVDGAGKKFGGGQFDGILIYNDKGTELAKQLAAELAGRVIATHEELGKQMFDGMQKIQDDKSAVIDELRGPPRKVNDP